MKNKPMKYLIHINNHYNELGFDLKQEKIFVYQTRTLTFTHDEHVADYLHISVKEYHRMLLQQFKAVLSKEKVPIADDNGNIKQSSIIYFKKKEHAREFIDAIQLLNHLASK